MKASRKIIGESFSKAANTYDHHSSLQKEVAGWLADRVKAGVCRQDMNAAIATKKAVADTEMKADAPEALRVLDIGCGTGNMAVLLTGILAKAAVYATDLAMPMLEKTRERLGADSLLAASDCEALPFSDSAFDIIVSSLAYQWAQDTDKAFKEAARVLKPGGRFFFTTLGPATLKELRECYSEASQGNSYPGPDCYPDSAALRSHLKEAGLEPLSIERNIVMRRYASLCALIRTLKKIGAAPVQGGNTGAAASDMTLRRAGRIYDERHAAPGGGVIATYEVILVSAEKI